MTGTSDKNVVYFADWNPDCIDSQKLPVTKVGVSCHPNVRMREITRKNCLPPFGRESIEIVATIDSTDDVYDVEEFFHMEFENQGWHVNGEWFELPDSVVEWVEERAATTMREIEETNWSMFGSRR